MDNITYITGWNYLNSYSPIDSSRRDVFNKDGVYIYNPGHGNEAQISATEYDIKCGNSVVIPAGKTAKVVLTKYTIGRPDSRWSIELLSA